MKILAITNNFPDVSNPYNGIFIYNTLRELSRRGHNLTVIAPQKAHKAVKIKREQLLDLDVIRPVYFSYSSKKIFGLNTFWWSVNSFRRCVVRTLREIQWIPDVVYSHFLFPAGVAALDVGSRLNAKVALSLGESDFRRYEKIYDISQLKDILSSFDYIFPSSWEIEKVLAENYGLDNQKIFLTPNGVDISKFRQMDKHDCRSKLGLPTDDKIVIFVGGFVERKGPLRVLEACRRASCRLKIIFIGSGDQKPTGDDIIFCGALNHDLLPLYLNAADVFVLPTKNEGMPNAILEAMACGVPIVASDIGVNKIIMEGYPYKRLCRYDDLGALAEGIVELLAEPVGDNFYHFPFSLRSRVSRIESVLRMGHVV